MKCIHCGKEIAGGNITYCPHCGKKQIKEEHKNDKAKETVDVPKNKSLFFVALLLIMMEVYLLYSLVGSPIPGDDNIIDEIYYDTLGVKTYVVNRKRNEKYIKCYPSLNNPDKSFKIRRGLMIHFMKIVSYNKKEYAYVEYCGRKGYIRSTALSFIANKSLYVKKGDTVFCNEKNGADILDSHINGKKLDKVSYGSEMKVEDIKDGWLQVSYDGEDTFGKAWISSNKVQSYNYNYYVVQREDSLSGGIALREAPDKEAEKYLRIPLGTQLECSGYKNGWGYFYYTDDNGDTYSGWLMLYYTTVVKKG